MQNPYKSPNSKLEGLPLNLELVKDRTMLVSWVSLSIVIMLLRNISMIKSGKPVGISVLDLVITPILVLYVMLAIRFIRGDEIERFSPVHIVKKFSVWSYIWRTLIIYWCAFVGAVLILMLAANSGYSFGAATFGLLSALLFLLLSLAVIILFFCDERKQALMRIVAIFRGY